MNWRYLITLVIISFTVTVTSANNENVTCSRLEYERCLHSIIDDVFTTHTDHCNSNDTVLHTCLHAIQEQCAQHHSAAISTIIIPYFNLLHNIYGLSCDSDQTVTVCDVREAVSCIKDLFSSLTSASVGIICRQTAPALKCLTPVKDKCSGVHRYAVALVTEELRLTSDLWCSHRICNLDIADRCIHAAKTAISYPTAVVTGSNLVCSDVRYALTCISNHTDVCLPGDVPKHISDGFMQLFQFSSAFCAPSTMYTLPFDIGIDLSPAIVLTKISTNRWTHSTDICKMFNETIEMAASEKQVSSTSNLENLFTWQNAMSLIVDKYTDFCFQHQAQSCDWMSRLANENPVCDVTMVNHCVDKVLLSKLVVDVYISRNTWENVCGVAYNMLACAQFYTGSCGMNDMSAILDVSQEVNNLVGFECSQLGLSGSSDACSINKRTCHVSNTIEQCGNITNISNACMHKDEIAACFHDNTQNCNSVEASLAQFYMEWLLKNCTHNATLVTDDMTKRIADCKLQFGYNINNGLQMYNEFAPIMCTAFTYYQQCLASQTVPDIVEVLMKDTDDMIFNLVQTLCNQTNNALVKSGSTEVDSCDMAKISGEVALYNNLFNSFPFISIAEQRDICRSYPNIANTWSTMVTRCSNNRQSIVTDAITFLNDVQEVLCPVTHPTTPMSCNLVTVYACLEDFGAFTYFADPNVDVCKTLDETFMCLHDNTMGCSMDIQNDLLMEVRAMHGMMGNITCPQSKVCGKNGTSSAVPWLDEICTEWEQCSVFGWLTCVEQNDITTSCQFYTQAVSCIEESLSGCDPLQYLFAKNEMMEWTQANSPFCSFIPNDPPSLTTLYRTIFECSNYISTSVDVTKFGICSSIDQYLNCLASIEQQDVLYTWRGILGRNVLLWQKHLYLDCKMSEENQFIVDTDINLDEVTSTTCESLGSQYCLRAYTNMAVTYFYIVPLSERQASVCARSDFYQQCVITQTTGCTNSLARTMLSSIVWVEDALNNVGTCNNDNVIQRTCDVTGAMRCIAELGHTLLQDLSTPSLDTVCSKLHSTSVCVNERTSSCSYWIRSEVSQTYSQVTAVVNTICTSPVSTPSTTSCIDEGETVMCDVEAALICMVPIQASMMHPNSTLEQVCGSIPEMQSCIHRATSGCDETTVAMVTDRVHRLSHRLNDRCPQIYCEQCAARQCLTALHRNMQYENVEICRLVLETKECIYRYAGYCSPIVSETLLREMVMLVGDDAYMCEITLQACLQTFMTSAYQIVSYTPSRNLSIQDDFILQQLCNEASSAYYCVSQQMISMDTERLEVMNSTLNTIGDFVYSKCNQVSSLRCYSCSNSSSYDECNQQGTETCAADKQMCGTYVTGNSIRKGCVEPDLCENGCVGYMCTMCCGTNLCNQPMDSVITDSPNCQPETAVYCAFQILFTIVQNDTMNCMTFQESVACMIQSTQGCMAPQSVSLGIQARVVMTSDVMTHCTSASPACTCGECSSMLLLSVIASPFGDQETFCRNVFDMYNQSMGEMDFSKCSITSLQTTANNLQMAAYVVQGICATSGVDETTDCMVDGVSHKHGTSYMASDGCNSCTCNMGDEACTLMYCPPTDRQCPEMKEGEIGTCVEMCTSDYECQPGELCCSNGCGHVCTQSVPRTNSSARDCIYQSSVYKSGDSFLATDGCNHCFCHDSMVGCTQMYCPYPDDRICDIVGIQECMNIAGLPYLVSMTTPNQTQHVCLSAAKMLKCIESKISSCPPDVTDVVHSAAWWQLDAIHTLCDMHTVIWTYLQPNTTTPDNKATCSLHSALQCMRNMETDLTCSSYDQLIDCVRDHTMGCLSVDMVGVLYELGYYLESSIIDCNFNMPELQRDFLYPVAECMQSFTFSISHDTTMNHLLNGNFDQLCHGIETFIHCLDDINNVQPVVKMIADNIGSTMKNLVNICHDLSKQDLTECYACQGVSCDDPQVVQCQPNQVCAAAVQLDMMTGVTTTTKGCADMQWCYQQHGCNPYTLMCADCCHGNRCNLEFNMTVGTTMTPTTVKPFTTTWRPQTSATTTMKATTTATQTTTAIPSSCDISYSVTSLMMHTLNLLNFNLLSIVDRQFLCQNYEESIHYDLDPSCPSAFFTHFEMLSEQMKVIASDVCVMFMEQQDRNKQCGEVIQCVVNVTTSPDKPSTCRSIQTAKDCLHLHYEYCDVTGQMAINNTLMLLSNMDFVICEPNKLLEGPDVECVAMTMKNASEVNCNVTMAMECGSYIHKAMHNPFLQQADYCRLVKRGMMCIRDNTYNCNASVLREISHYVSDLVQGMGNICPDVWCPAEEVCSSDTAWDCLNSLDGDLTEMVDTGNWSNNICKSLVKTHNCILNNTDNCYTADRQRLIQNFHIITSVADAFCRDNSAYLHQCVDTFHHRVDELINFDQFSTAEMLKLSLRNSLKTYILRKQYNSDADRSEESMFDSDSSEVYSQNLPELLSFLLRDNQLQTINLPSFLLFLSEVMQEEQLYESDSGYGLNIPGAYGIALPGSRTPDYSGGPEIHNHIENITNILFGINTNYRYSEVIEDIKIILNVSDADIVTMMRDADVSVYTTHKQKHCSSVLDAKFCIENSIQLASSSIEQKYIFQTALNLLNGVITDSCEVTEGMCHSCTGLHSNEECNSQPQTQCGPLDVCQAKVVDSHFFKGCYSKLACEEDCKRTSKACYCCHGYQCNKYIAREYDMTRKPECTVQSAVDATMDLLLFVLNYTENDTLIHTKAMTMIESTTGCHGDHFRNIHTEGQRLLKYLETKDCSLKSSPDSCDIEGLISLTSLVANPYHTVETMDTMCRLYDIAVQDILKTNPSCCPAMQSMITIYQHLNELCNITDIIHVQDLCTLILSDTCLIDQVASSNISTNETRAANTDISHAVGEGHFCHMLTNYSNNNNNSADEIKLSIPTCNVQLAMKCFKEDLDCSESGFTKVLGCVNNHSEGCSIVQMVPVAIETERVAYSCNITDDTVHFLKGINKTSPFQCFENLATFTRPLESGLLLSTICSVIEQTSKCIQSSVPHDGHLEALYIEQIHSKMVTFTTNVCMNEHVANRDMADNKRCDLSRYTGDIIHHLTFTLTSGLIHPGDTCRVVDEIKVFQENISSCVSGNNLLPLLSWIQEQNEITCLANLAWSTCQHNVCKVERAENLVHSLGYFVGVSKMDNTVFCRKVENVRQGVKCALQNCDDRRTSRIHESMDYIQSIVGARCPGDHGQCDSMDTESNTSSRYENVSSTEEMCNTYQAQMCLFEVTLPSPTDQLFCSKMMSAVEGLSECVHPKLIGCHGYQWMEIKNYYSGVFATIGYTCNADFSMKLFDDGCTDNAQCSHVDALACITSLNNGPSCGNLEEVTQCIHYATEGCNSIQTFALMTSLQANAILHQLPKSCWENLVTAEDNVNRTANCILSFQQDLFNLSSPGQRLCDMMVSLMTCMEDSLMLHDMLGAVRESLIHVTKVAKYPLQMVCSLEDEHEFDVTSTDRQCPEMKEGEIGTCVEMCTSDYECQPGELCCSNGCGHICTQSVPRTNSNEHEFDVTSKDSNNSLCNMDAVKSCLISYAANVLLVPAFSQDAKQAICDDLSHGMLCVRAIEGHCNMEKVQHLHRLTSLLESLAQLSGTCSPLPVTCSPEVATHCINDLSHAVSQHETNQHHVCWTVDQSDTCVKQTLSGCNKSMKEFFMNIYESIRCRALSLCPMKIEIHNRESEKPTSCVDPSAMVIHGGTCQPAMALKCLQDAYVPLMGPFAFEKNQVCSNYLESLACFFNNINGCEDDTVMKLAMYQATMTMNRFDTVCDVTVRHGCDAVQTGKCKLDQVEACIHKFLNATEFGKANENCMSKKMLLHCYEYNTESCPRVTKLYMEMKIHMLIEDVGNYDNDECHDIIQCVHDYTTVFDKTLQLADSFFHASKQRTVDSMEHQAAMIHKEAETLFLCHMRLEASSCLTSNLPNMVSEHADVLGLLLYGMDSILVDVCSVLIGLQNEIPYCNTTCIDCLIRRKDYTRILELLTSIEVISVNGSGTMMGNGSDFCRDYELVTAERMDNSSCSTDIVTCGWHSSLMDSLDNLHGLYCAKPCNTSSADVCILDLENSINTLNNENICLTYDETFQCLEESLKTCDLEVLNQYANVATEIFNTTGIVCYTMPSFMVEYEAAHMRLMEGGAPQSISVTMMTPMVDICKGTNCFVGVFISIDDAVFASCSSGDEIPGILLDVCSFTFSNDSADSHVIQMFARSDLRTTASRNATFHVVAQLWTDDVIVIESILATVTMEVVDRDSTSECYIISEPYIRTFDGLNYYNFRQGEYVLYQHSSLSEKVHIGFQRCVAGKLSVCPCVIMIQADNDVFIVDRCRRSGETSHAFEFKVYQYGGMSEEIKVYSTNERNSLDFVLPSGAIVYVRAAQQLLDVWVKPSARDWGHTSGLCGTMDGNPENDLTLPDGTITDLDAVDVWRQVLLPDDFVTAWRPGNSLFGGVPVEMPVTEDTTAPGCICTNNTCTPTSQTETCGYTTGADITHLLDIYLQETSNQKRKKRQIDDVWSTIDFDSNDTTVLPTWPTINGWTEDIATKACEEGLTSHELWDTCSVVMDTSVTISTCVTDILLTDSADAIQNAVEDMKSVCKMTVMSDPSISVTLNTTAEQLIAYIYSFTCPNDCTSHGQCVDDVCECDNGFGGEDCSLSVEKAPTVYSTSKSLFIPTLSISSSTETNTVIVYGESFVRSDSLTCHVTTEQGQSSTSKALFLTGGTIQCEVTGTYPYVKLQLSTSNDGVNQSNSVSIIYHDPVCYSCDQTLDTCIMQPTSCVIDGLCYAAGDFNPNDSCQLCDPISNEWKFKASSSCSTTTSSTAETSTSQTPSVSSTSSSISSSTQSTSSTTSAPLSSEPSSSSLSTSSSVTPSSSADPTPSSSADPTPISSTESTPRSSTDVSTGTVNKAEEQDGDTGPLTIIIIVAVVIGGVLIMAVIGFALRLRKKDSKRGSVLGNVSEPSTGSDPSKGQINPAYSDAERKGQLIQQGRIVPGYSASFNPQGLGQPGIRTVYAEPQDYNDVDVAMFEDRRDRGTAPVVSRQVGEVVMEVPYRIPRPVTATVPASRAPQYVVRVEHDYDNAERIAQRKVPKSSMPDYYENNDNMSDTSSTRL